MKKGKRPTVKVQNFNLEKWYIFSISNINMAYLHKKMFQRRKEVFRLKNSIQLRLYIAIKFIIKLTTYIH